MRKILIIATILISSVYALTLRAENTTLADFENGHQIDEKKYMDMLKNYIQNGGEVNRVIPNSGGDYTLLLDAAEDGKYLATKYLLENGADKAVDQRDKFGQTALWITDNPQIAKLLLQYGASIYIKRGELTLYEKHKNNNSQVAEVIKEFIKNTEASQIKQNPIVFETGEPVSVLFKSGKRCNATILISGKKQSKVEYNEWCESGLVSSKSKGEKEWAPNNALSSR